MADVEAPPRSRPDTSVGRTRYAANREGSTFADSYNILITHEIGVGFSRPAGREPNSPRTVYVRFWGEELLKQDHPPVIASKICCCWEGSQTGPMLNVDHILLQDYVPDLTSGAAQVFGPSSNVLSVSCMLEPSRWQSGPQGGARRARGSRWTAQDLETPRSPPTRW